MTLTPTDMALILAILAVIMGIAIMFYVSRIKPKPIKEISKPVVKVGVKEDPEDLFNRCYSSKK